MKKKICYCEAAYAAGLAILALGTALMEAADFGVSMVVAPAYLLYLKVSQTIPAFTFGMAEYVLQAFVLALLTLCMRRFRLQYLFSFVTALIYGVLLDGAMTTVGLLPVAGVPARCAAYGAGLVLCSLGVALLFHTYIAPEAYELFVKEIAGKSGRPVSQVKTIYDCVSCAAAVMMSFAFFGLWHFEGVKLGTILCALVNGSLIGLISRVLNACFTFKDGLKLRWIFE